MSDRIGKNVFIISATKIYNGNSAGAARIMNIARALSMEGTNVYLCSSTYNDEITFRKLLRISDKIFVVGKEGKRKLHKLNKLRDYVKIIVYYKYLLKIARFVKQISGDKAFYLYPTNDSSMDFMVIIVLRILNRFRVYCDINELRRASMHNIVLPNNPIKCLYRLLFFPIRYLKYLLAELLTGCYNGIIVISTNIENYFKKFNSNTIRIPILSDIRGDSFVKKPFYNKSKNFNIGFFGQLSLKKEGFELFYRALSMVKSNFSGFKLHLYGPFLNERERDLLLDVLPTKYNLKENIIYHGVIAQNDVFTEMQKNHLLILPRPLNLQTKYGFSTKLSEYLISGIPVLLTDVSDNSLYIKDGYNGFIVPAGDMFAMAKKILHIVNKYNNVVPQVCENAFKTAYNEFYYGLYGKRLLKFLFPNKKYGVLKG